MIFARRSPEVVGLIVIGSSPRLTDILTGPLVSAVPSREWRQIGRVERKTISVTLVDYSMSYSTPADQTAAVVAALAELGVRPEERVLIMLPDGPGFAEAFAGTIAHEAVPLPVDPLLPAHGIMAVAAEAAAQLVLASADRVSELADLAAEPPVPVDGPHGPWAAALRLRSSDEPQAQSEEASK